MESELDAREESQRPFRPHHQLGEVLLRLTERIDVVTAHLAQQPGNAARDLFGIVRMERPHRGRDLREPARRAGKVGRDLAEGEAGSVGEDRLHLEHVVDHDPVLDRSRSRRVVPGHAADGGVRGGGDVDGKLPAGRLELPVQLVEDDARLHDGGSRLGVDLQHGVHVAAGVQHHGAPERLAVLRAAAASGDDGKSLLAGQRDGRLDVLGAFRQRHADGLDLVDGCVGRVAASAERIEEDVAAHRPAQPRRKHRIAGDSFPRHRDALLAQVSPWPFDAQRRFEEDADGIRRSDRASARGAANWPG